MFPARIIIEEGCEEDGVSVTLTDTGVRCSGDCKYVVSRWERDSTVEGSVDETDMIMLFVLDCRDHWRFQAREIELFIFLMIVILFFNFFRSLLDTFNF